MSARISTIFATLVLVVSVTLPAHAQSADRVSFGAAVTVANLPRPGEPEAPYIKTPYGNSRGFEVYGWVGVSHSISVGAEVSVASPASLTTVETHIDIYTTRTMSHRDTLAVALLRYRTGPFLDLVGGGGVVFPRTSLTESGWHFRYGGQVRAPFGPLVYQSPSNGARPAVAAGLDLSVPLHRHFAIVGIARYFHLSRDAPRYPLPFGNSSDGYHQPSASVLRAGVGFRISM